MSSSVEQNLVEGNKAYAASFTEGHLALPPSQKYAIRKWNWMQTSLPKLTCNPQ